MLTLTPGNVKVVQVNLSNDEVLLELSLEDGDYEEQLTLDIADLGSSGYSIKKLELASENYLITVVCEETSNELTKVSVSFDQISATCSNQLRLAA